MKKMLFTNKQIFLFLKILVSILVITFLLHIISFSEILNALVQAKKEYLLLGFLLLGLNIFLQFKKWHVLVLLEKPHAAKKEIFLSLLAGITLGFITPGRLGEFGRSLFISKTNWTHLFSFILVDKLLVLLYVVLFGIIGLTYFIKSYFALHFWIIISVLAFVLEIILVYYIAKPSKLKKTIKPLTSRYSIVAKMTEGFQKLNGRVIKKLILLNLCYYLTFSLQFLFLIASFHPLPFFKCLIAVFAILIVKTMFPIAVGDLGVREGATVLFLSHFHTPKAAAFNASLVLFIINILLPSLVGFLIILKKRAVGFTSK